MRRDPAPAIPSAAVADPQSLLTGGDRPGDERSITFFGEPLARWIVFVAGSVLIVIALLLAGGFWAKRKVLRL